MRDVFYAIKALVDGLADMLIQEGDPLSNRLLRLGLYVLVFVGLPLVVLVSLPYGLGLIVLIGFIALLIFGIPNF